MHNFQKKLKEARESLGLSQQALAEKLGVSLRSQQNYEAGIRQPDATYLTALAAVGADVTYILTGLAGSNVGEALGRDPRVVMGRHAIEALGPNPGAVMGAAAAEPMPGNGAQAVLGDEARLLAAFRASDSAGRVAVLTAAEGVALLAKVSRKKGG